MRRLLQAEIDNVQDDVGIYELFLCDASGNPREIQRLGGRDDSGLLYIGRAFKPRLRKRLYELRMSLDSETNTHNHPAGRKYLERQVLFQTLFGDHEFWFDCVAGAASEEEAMRLRNYSVRFGEYPPLNK